MQLPLQTEALVLSEAGGPFVLTPIVIQDLRPDEVLVEIKYSGVCHTVCTPPSQPSRPSQ
jgi:Zn-dependent alcohol dehydrogenase